MNIPDELKYFTCNINGTQYTIRSKADLERLREHNLARVNFYNIFGKVPRGQVVHCLKLWNTSTSTNQGNTKKVKGNIEQYVKDMLRDLIPGRDDRYYDVLCNRIVPRLNIDYFDGEDKIMEYVHNFVTDFIVTHGLYKPEPGIRPTDKELFVQAYKKYGGDLFSMTLGQLKQEYGSFLLPMKYIKDHQEMAASIYDGRFEEEKPKPDEELQVWEITENFDADANNLEQLVNAIYV